VLKNKQSQEAFVRIPIWVDKGSVQCRLGDKELDCRWFVNYLHFQNLKSGDILTITFPMRERTEKWTIGDTVHTFHFRGNTLVSISPPAFSEIYDGRVDKFAGDKAPMRTLVRFTTPKILHW